MVLVYTPVCLNGLISHHVCFPHGFSLQGQFELFISFLLVLEFGSVSSVLLEASVPFIAFVNKKRNIFQKTSCVSLVSQLDL